MLLAPGSLTRFTEGKVIPDAGFEVLHEADTSTNVPSRVHILLAKVRARAKVAPLHVLKGKAKLWTCKHVYASYLAQPDVITHVDRNFECAIRL